MSDTRPVNLELTTIQLPITAYASILHRVCAVISWIGLGILLVAVTIAARSQTNFDGLSNAAMDNIFIQFIAWGFLSAFGYYCIGSVKHIIQDFGFFESKEGGKLISAVALVLGALLSLAIGVYIWL